MIAQSTALVSQLENSLGVPTVAFFANWTGEYSVDADEEAGRLLTKMVVDRLRSESSDALALVLGSRGGYPAFADALLRTVRHLEVELRVVIPCRVDGAAGLVSLGADEIILHPGAGVGAVDSGLCVVPKVPIDASLFEHCPMEPEEFAALDPSEEVEMARLTYDRFVRHEQRRMAQRLVSAGGEAQLIEDWVGRGGTVAHDELLDCGVEVRIAPVPLAEQLEELCEWAGRALHLFRRPDERFEFSGELADEVEFEPATEVAAAAIVTVDRAWLHKLDTGSPDPHAPRLLGEWQQWNSEAQSAEEGE